MHKKTKLISLIFILLITTSFNADNKVTMDYTEAQKAFELLNDIRMNPEKYHKILDYKKNLKVTRTRLAWNDTLAEVAEHKAFDMAQHNYFDHVDRKGYGINYYIEKAGYRMDDMWTKNPKNNFFESLCGGDETGEQVIIDLITDKDVESLKHRKHLLGVGEWYSTLKDIGIGFARREEGSFYTTYISIIIAKHDDTNSPQSDTVKKNTKKNN